MSMQNHLAQLERRHKALESEIEKETIHPSSDEAKLGALKKKKLLLKDEITKIKQTEAPLATVH